MNRINIAKKGIVAPTKIYVLRTAIMLSVQIGYIWSYTWDAISTDPAVREYTSNSNCCSMASRVPHVRYGHRKPEFPMTTVPISPCGAREAMLQLIFRLADACDTVAGHSGLPQYNQSL